MRISILLVVLVLVAPGHPANAQVPVRPHWSVGIALGEGPRTSRAGDVYYQSSTSNTGQLALAYRLGRGRMRPMLRAELLSEGPGSDWSDCPPAPNGSCLEDFPAPDGIGAAAGVAYALAPRVEAALLAGVGRYDSTTRRSVEVEGAVGITRRLAGTVGVRYMVWREPDRGHHWYLPVNLGLRALW